jgi:hypothetical protein
MMAILMKVRLGLKLMFGCLLGLLVRVGLSCRRRAASGDLPLSDRARRRRRARQLMQTSEPVRLLSSVRLGKTAQAENGLTAVFRR